jgi:hypothetical protein
MLNKDAADVEERINNVILGIRGNYVCHDTDIIKGLEIVKGVNETVNAEIMDEEPEIEREDAAELTDVKGVIEFKDREIGEVEKLEPTEAIEILKEKIQNI